MASAPLSTLVDGPEWILMNAQVVLRDAFLPDVSSVVTWSFRLVYRGYINVYSSLFTCMKSVLGLCI